MNRVISGAQTHTLIYLSRNSHEPADFSCLGFGEVQPAEQDDVGSSPHQIRLGVMVTSYHDMVMVDMVALVSLRLQFQSSAVSYSCSHCSPYSLLLEQLNILTAA